MQIATFGDDLDNIQSDNLIHNRLNFRCSHKSGLSAALEIRNRIFWGESVEMNPFMAASMDIDPGLVDMSWVVFETPAALGHSQIDRAWIEWSSERWEIRAGRQRINWGINLLWNSNDLFNVYSILDFDYEERPGGDALRIQHHFKNYTSLDAAISHGADSKSTVAAAMYRFNKFGYDLQVLGGLWHEDIAAGLGLAGNVGNAGLKGEGTYFTPLDRDSSKSAISASLSLDYVFNGGLFGTLGFLYSSDGPTDNLLITDLYTHEPSPRSLMPSAYNGALSLSYPFSPILNAGITGLWSPASNMIIAIPTLSVSLSNDWEFAIFGQSFWIETDDLSNISNAIYFRLKWSFYEEVRGEKTTSIAP
jgi:hypothetical protein